MTRKGAQQELGLASKALIPQNHSSRQKVQCLWVAAVLVRAIFKSCGKCVAMTPVWKRFTAKILSASFSLYLSRLSAAQVRLPSVLSLNPDSACVRYISYLSRVLGHR